MNHQVKYDENLWFEHLGCEGLHYLIGNPHTFYGRISAWCPLRQTTLSVSISEIGEMSESSKYWIQGFLNGNQPKLPGIDTEVDIDFEGPAFKTWVEASRLFLETGYWWSGEARECETCGKDLLASEPKDICRDCSKL